MFLGFLFGFALCIVLDVVYAFGLSNFDCSFDFLPRLFAIKNSVILCGKETVLHYMSIESFIFLRMLRSVCQYDAIISNLKDLTLKYTLT